MRIDPGTTGRAAPRITLVETPSHPEQSGRGRVDDLFPLARARCAFRPGWSRQLKLALGPTPVAGHGVEREPAAVAPEVRPHLPARGRGGGVVDHGVLVAGGLHAAAAVD